MMKTINLSLNKNKSFSSTNETQKISVDFEREEKLLPISSVQGSIDAYEQYLKEKDACNKYRFVFTIHPYCTNVLFNHITEAVYREGSNDCFMVLKENDTVLGKKAQKIHYRANVKTSCKFDKSIKTCHFEKEKGDIITKCKSDDSYPITRDTGYSDSSGQNGITGFLNYNCGIDIFNNHLLRRKDFVCVNTYDSTYTTHLVTGSPDAVKPKKSARFNVDGSDNINNNININNTMKNDLTYFNTLFDSVRDYDGSGKLTFFSKEDSSGKTSSIHLYNTDSIYSFTETIKNKLIEENGWFGFRNDTILNLSPKTSPYRINSVINNMDPCSFVDMYPTRKHFSFVPHYNKYRERMEKNWEYILTYPFENDYDNIMVCDSESINGVKIFGIKCDVMFPQSGFSGRTELFGDDTSNKEKPLYVTFQTYIKHTLMPGDRIRLSMYNKKDVYAAEDISVVSVGNGGYDSQHYFSVRYEDIAYHISRLGECSFRFEKKTGGQICRYYLRKFRKIPNFKNTSINPKNGVNVDDINNALEKTDFSSSINKLGFSKTIYGDDIAQIVYDDDIDVTGLKDNWGRELSVIYLSIIKTNYGYVDWYIKNIYNSDDIEYSHCFGNVTSGFDMPEYVDEYNVRKQHNISLIDWRTPLYIHGSSKMLEKYVSLKYSLTYGKDEYGNVKVTGKEEKKNFEFYGDIVELDLNTLQETVLEKICHRFNTAQRESYNDIFGDMYIDSIEADDYSPESGFTRCVTKHTFIAKNNNPGGRINMAAEGYYYEPHYPIRIREYSNVVNTGYHTRIGIVDSSGFTFTTDRNYFLEIGEELRMYHMDPNDKRRYTAIVKSVSGDDFRKIKIAVKEDPEDDNLNNYIILKPNILMPEGAYDFDDETGRYIWRDMLPHSKVSRDSELYDSMFTNGAIYMHKNINFYLKRQDPYGEFGMQPTTDEYYVDGMLRPSDFEMGGEVEDVSDGIYFEPGENNIC